MSGTATVLGFAYESPVTDFPVRTGPGTSFAKAPFNIKKGTGNLQVLDVQPDQEETKSDFGRVYQWFNLQFADGQTGWMRDHVIGIQGDWSAYGYGKVLELKHAYLLERNMSKVKAAPAKEKSAEEEETLNPLAAAAQAAIRATQQFVAAVTGDKPDEPAQPAIMQKQEALAKPAGPARVIIKTQASANTRQGPSTVGFERVVAIPRNVEVPILAVQKENRGQCLRWFKVNYSGRDAWIREDLVQYTGDTEPLGLPWDLYPAPIDERWWVRDYNRDPYRDTSTWEHWGWDFGAAAGEPIRCGPLGGTVVKAFDCPKCSPDRPSTIQNGLSLSDPGVLQDEGWGFGYGNYVIVRYSYNQLPDSTQQALANMGFPNGAIFVMYAHLQKRAVEEGQQLTSKQVIGYCGNSGNSEASHLHLELRASKKDPFSGWSTIKDGLMSPIVLFNR